VSRCSKASNRGEVGVFKECAACGTHGSLGDKKGLNVLIVTYNT